MKRPLAMREFVWLAILGLLATAAFASKENDQQIQKDVEKLLQSKKQFQEVRATTDDQIVTLEGTVNLYINLADLQKKVQRIKKVEGVRNHVTVSSSVPDDKLRETLGTKLTYDRVGYGHVFNAVTLDVQDGVVTLGGKVYDYPGRDSAVAIAESTPGVKDVIDNIEVLPTSNFDDELRTRLYRAIYGSSSLRRYAQNPARPIRIVVENGHVTLYGVVDTQLDKQLAYTQASSVPGVFSVDNQLVVPAKQPK